MKSLMATPTLHPSTQGFAEALLRPTESPHTLPRSPFAGMSCFGQAVSSQHVSPRVADIIAASWRDSTKKQYQTYLEKWQTYCGGRGINPISASIAEGLDFLEELHETGVGYSAMNTARSALSTVIELRGSTFGSHHLVSRFMKGIFERRPYFSRYKQIWNVNQVLQYLRTPSPAYRLDLKQLTKKLLMLIAVLSAKRAQSLHLLDI